MKKRKKGDKEGGKKRKGQEIDEGKEREIRKQGEKDE